MRGRHSYISPELASQFEKSGGLGLWPPARLGLGEIPVAAVFTSDPGEAIMKDAVIPDHNQYRNQSPGCNSKVFECNILKNVLIIRQEG